MLKKSERLARADFLPFFKSGKRINSEHLQLIYAHSPSFHASVVVSKKVSKLAVVRNTVRRRIYAHLKGLSSSKQGVYIVTVKPTFATLSRQAMHLEITALIERLVKTA